MDWAALVPYLPDLARGFAVTVALTFGGAACALFMAIGLVLATSAGGPAIRRSVRIYTEIILGLPILVLLYLIYFVLPQLGLRIGEVAAGILTLTLYYAPYMAEAIRGAIASVPAGQVDAARMIGLNPVQIFIRILLPQTLGLLIPPLTGILIGLAKDTAILSVISVHELAYATKRVVSRTYTPFEVWALVAGLYWLALSALEVLMRRLEGRVTRFRASGASA
ncbi:MAG: amino acid ABC transporter permease [Bauldia sp.]|nr:amino acid ABC transporter permease [Bauldia sp.]